MSYTTSFTEYAEAFLLENVLSERVLERVEHTVDLLAQYPALRRVYDPQYPAAIPPFPCRSIAVADTPFTLYYVIDDGQQELTIVSVEWSAGDPAKRFTGLY